MKQGELVNISRAFHLRKEQNPKLLGLVLVAVFQILAGLFAWFILLEKAGWLYWITFSGLIFVLLNLSFEFDPRLLRIYDKLLWVGLALFVVQGLFVFLADHYQIHWTYRIFGGDYGIWQIKGTTYMVRHGERFLCPELFGRGFPGCVPCIVLLVLTLESFARRFPLSFQRKMR
jgi:hypothetical protein